MWQTDRQTPHDGVGRNIHRVHIKKCHWFFHNNFYKYARIFMIFGTQLCKWILIILVNLLRCVPCTSLTWWRNGDVTEIMPFTMHVTMSPCCRERDATSLSLQRCGQIWIRWTTTSGVSFKRGSTVRRSMMWRSWKSAERVKAAGPHHHRGSNCTVA